MSSPADSSTNLSPVEEAFAEFLALQDEGSADFEAFCGARPELSSGLRRLHERWVAFDRAVSADLQVDSGAAGSEASAEDLLRGLPRSTSEDSRYESRGEIGRGGMGRVIKVWDHDLRRSLAMKVLQDRGKRDPRSLARFLDEALVTGQLEHPGIVPVHELGLDADGRVYFTMPFVRGENLQRVFERVWAGDPEWSRARAIGLLLRVCEAVGYAHVRGVVHRDLKPANVMVGPFGETYVMDWGLARILGDSEREEVPAAPAAPAVSHDVRSVRVGAGEEMPASSLTTMEGDVVGTPVYMAPEQAHGWVERVGPKTDVYSIGAMLYQLLTGSRPYLSPGEEDSSQAVLRAVQSRAPRPVHTLADDVPPELEAICDKAMARDAAERYASTMELAADLQAFLEQRVVGAYETGAGAELRKWVERNRRLAVAIGAGLIALLAGLAISTVLFLQARRNENTALEEQARADANAERLEEELRKSHLAQGGLAGANGHFERAEELLWREHLRRPEPASRWHLWELYARYPRRDATAVPYREYDVEQTPDGSVVLVAGGATPNAQTELLLVDAESLSILERLPAGHGQQRIAVDAAGREALTAGLGGDVRIWDLLVRREAVGFSIEGAAIWDVAYHAGADRWILGCDDGTLRVLDRGGTEVGALRSTSGVRSLAVSPDGEVVAAGAADGAILIWRGLDAEPLAVDGAHRHWVTALDFTPDGARLFAGSLDRRVSEWDCRTGERLWVHASKNGDVRGVRATSSDLVALGGWYRTDLVDARTREVRGSIYAPQGVRGVAHPAPDHLTILHMEELLNWDLEPERQALRFTEMRGWLAGAFEDDGRLALGDREGRVRVHAPFSDRIEAEWREDGGIGALAYAPGEGLLAVGVGREVHLRELPSGELRCSFPGGGGASAAKLEFSPEGDRIATTTDGGETPFALHRTDTGDPVARFGRPGEEALSVRFSPTGHFVATVTRTARTTGDWAHWLSTWTLDGKERSRCETDAAWKIAVSPDGTRIATGQWRRDVHVWDPLSGELVAELRGHNALAWSVDWHPTNPGVLASCSDDGTMRLWDAEREDLLLTIEVPSQGQLTWVRFGPDGGILAACGSGSEAVLWDLTYFDRHIAGNAAFQIGRWKAELGDELQAESISSWAAEVLARPWPRFGR